MPRRSIQQQKELDSEIIRRISEFQAIREISYAMKCNESVIRRLLIGYERHYITPEERNYLLIRRKQINDNKI